jgi:hypothetical protein
MTQTISIENSSDISRNDIEKIINIVLVEEPLTIGHGINPFTKEESTRSFIPLAYFTDIPKYKHNLHDNNPVMVKFPVIFKETKTDKGKFFRIGRSVDLFNEFIVDRYPEDILISAELYLGQEEPIFLVKTITLANLDNAKQCFFDKPISTSYPHLFFWIKINMENKFTNVDEFDRNLLVYCYMGSGDYRHKLCCHMSNNNHLFEKIIKLENITGKKENIPVSKPKEAKDKFSSIFDNLSDEDFTENIRKKIINTLLCKYEFNSIGQGLIPRPSDNATHSCIPLAFAHEVEEYKDLLDIPIMTKFPLIYNNDKNGFFRIKRNADFFQDFTVERYPGDILKNAELYIGMEGMEKPTFLLKTIELENVDNKTYKFFDKPIYIPYFCHFWIKINVESKQEMNRNLIVYCYTGSAKEVHVWKNLRIPKYITNIINVEK